MAPVAANVRTSIESRQLFLLWFFLAINLLLFALFCMKVAMSLLLKVIPV